MDSIVSNLLRFAESQPNVLAMIDRGRGVTYGDLGANVKTAAAWLHHQGVRVGDTVALTLDLAPESALPSLQFFYGLAYLGAAILPFHPGVPAASHADLALRFGARHWIHGPGARPAANISLIDPRALHSAPAAALGFTPPRGDQPDRPFYYHFTSGTTGSVKVVLFTVAQGAGWAQSGNLYGSTSSDRHVAALPWPKKVGVRDLCRIHAVGGTFVNEDFPLTRQKLAALVSEYGVTQLSSSPSQVRILLSSEAPPGVPMPKLRVLTVGGAPIFPHEVAQARQALTPNVYVTYGTNELGRMAHLQPDEPADVVGKVGKPLAHIEAQAVTDDDQPAPTGTVGKLRFRSPWMTHGYVGNEEATARHFRDGWFYPGDLGLIDADGYIVLRGRNDDMINYSGVKVMPNEIEVILRQHPAISDVAVIGVDDATFGQLPIAFVVLRQRITAEELHDFCAQRIDAGRRPNKFMSLEEIPRNAANKAMRDQLRQIYLTRNQR